jgi:hypothetical protein
MVSTNPLPHLPGEQIPTHIPIEKESCLKCQITYFTALENKVSGYNIVASLALFLHLVSSGKEKERGNVKGTLLHNSSSRPGKHRLVENKTPVRLMQYFINMAVFNR